MTEKTLNQLDLILSKMQPDTEYKVEEVAEWLEVSRTRARSLIKMLVDEGKVLETGITKLRRYRLNVF